MKKKKKIWKCLLTASIQWKPEVQFSHEYKILDFNISRVTCSPGNRRVGRESPHQAQSQYFAAVTASAHRPPCLSPPPHPAPRLIRVSIKKFKKGNWFGYL